MFCNQCGCELPDNSRFCLKCGARLPELGTRPAPAQQPQAQPAPVGSAPEPLCLTLQAYVDEAQIRGEKRLDKSGRPEQFIFYLQDGRGLRLNLTGNKAVGPAIAQVFRA